MIVDGDDEVDSDGEHDDHGGSGSRNEETDHIRYE